MKRLAFLAILFAAACTTAPMQEPSLAPRAAEAIDPRLPIPDTVPTGPVDATLAARLGELVDAVRAGTSAFETQEAQAARLASAAGPMASESWIAAQQALSVLIDRYGVTTRAAADIDALASSKLEGQHWIRPADQQAIGSAAAEVAAISNAQHASIERLKDQLAR